MFKKKFLQSIVSPIIKKILHNLAKYYIIDKKYDQLVVYSHDTISAEINLDGFYEKDRLLCLVNFLKDKNFKTYNKIALDVGAYIGNHSIFFAKIFQEVLSFEPHPKSFEILKINCKNFTNIKIHNFGCSNKNGKSFLRLKHTNVGGSSISNGNHQRDFAVQVIKLDNFLRNSHKRIGLIKIDVEGHEEKVIDGCINLLKKNKPIIFMELKNKNNKIEPRIIKKLKLIGYSHFFELENKIKLNKFENNFFLSTLDKLISIFLKNPILLKEIKKFKKKEYQNIVVL